MPLEKGLTQDNFVILIKSDLIKIKITTTKKSNEKRILWCKKKKKKKKIQIWDVNVDNIVISKLVETKIILNI